MIGGADVDVTGVDAPAATRVPVLRDGAWQV